MLSWILQISIISIIFIFLVHHLLSYFKSTLTIPKIKDLVNSPIKKYQHIFDTISNSNSSKNINEYLPDAKYSSNNYNDNNNNDDNNNNNNNNNNDYTDIDLLPNANTIANTIANSNTNSNSNTNTGMKNELKMFLKKQLNSTDNIESSNYSSGNYTDF